MRQAALRTGLSPDEYLAFERAAEGRHEYANGEIFAMAGATRAHNLIAGNIFGEIRAALLARRCEVYMADMRVKIAATGRYVYPDVVAACGRLDFEDDKTDTLLNPSLIVEVLSESTEGYDRGDKFAQYRSIPSVMEILLVPQDKAQIEHYTRQPDGAWLLRVSGPGERLSLDSIGCVLEVDRAYGKVFEPPFGA